VGPPAIYAVVAMGGVFAAAAQAPLTAIASVVEMTGNFTLVLPVMLAAGIAAAISKRFSYGSIYTTKLLRRGIDIERPKATGVLQALTVADVMQPLPQGVHTELVPHAHAQTQPGVTDRTQWETLVGPVTVTRRLQTLMSDETLEQALRQLDLYGLVGLPVLSPDRHHLNGWMTRRDVIRAIAQNLSASASQAEKGTLAAEFAIDDPESHVHEAPNPLEGYEVIEITIGSRSPQLGRRFADVPWPLGSVVVAVTEGSEVIAPRSDSELCVGERVILLAPTSDDTRTPQESDTPTHDQ
jgi:CIC family chloride channel protein